MGEPPLDRSPHGRHTAAMAEQVSSQVAANATAERDAGVAESIRFRDAFEAMPKGRTFALPRSRRLVGDLLAYWKTVPCVTQHRRLHIPRLASTRPQMTRRISWPVMFAKAHALVAAEMPELRRLYLGWPWARLYEHPTSACRMTVSREVDGNDAVFMSRTFDVEQTPLTEFDDEIRFLATTPIDDVPLIQRQLKLASVPTLLRRLMWKAAANLSGPLRVNFLGTFMVTTVSKWDVVSLTPPVISNATLSFGRVDADGFVDAYLVYDHRAFDGALNAQALLRLEQMLDGPICDELIALQPDR